MANQEALIIRDSGGTEADVTASNALKVDGSAATQPVSAASLPLPTGAATSANQAAELAILNDIDTTTSSYLDAPLSTLAKESGGNLAATATVLGATADAAVDTDTTGTVSGKLRGLVKLIVNLLSRWPAALGAGGGLKVDGSGTALPVTISAGTAVIGHVITDTGSTTAVTGNVTVVQPTGTNLHAVLDANSGVDIGKLTDNQSVNITQVAGTTIAQGHGVAATAVRVELPTDGTGVVGLNAGSAIVGKVGIDQTTPGTTDRVTANVDKIGGTAIVTGGTGGSQGVGGIQAHDAADSGNNPVKIGAKANSSEPAAVSTGDIANLITDLVGKLIVLPYANPENFVSGAITSAMTGTTSTSLLAAPAGSLRNYITTIIVSNSHATVGTDIIIQDGNGGTTLMTIPAASVYGGAVITLPTPLRQPTAATAIYCANVTTGASTKVSAVGYKGL